MRLSGSQLAVPTAIVVIMVGAAEMHAAEAPVSSQEIRAKIDYCKTCHGVSGQGYRGAFPMPRLAGQQPEYLENQLKAFIERRRMNPIMANVAHVLNASMLTGLAAHFKTSIQSRWAARRRKSWRQERRSMTRGFPALTFLRALPATGQSLKVMGHFLASQASSMTTS